MTKTRKQYSKEFKLDAISLVLDQGYSRKEAAASLEINAQMLGRWIKESKDEDGQAFRACSKAEKMRYHEKTIELGIVSGNLN